MSVYDRYSNKFLALPFFIQGLFWLVLISLIKFDNLFERPVWDSAMGVFPAAVFLFETGFDYQELLRSSGWGQGGPNVHPLALLPLVIASVMKLTSSADQMLFVLHLLTFIISALAITVFSNVLKDYGVSGISVLLSCLAVALMPLVLVQVGSIYEEILVFSFSLFAWSYWCKGKHTATFFMCAICLAVKLTGIVIVLCIGLSVVLNRRLWNVKNVVFLVALGVIAGAAMWLPALLFKSPDVLRGWGHDSYIYQAFIRLVYVPDLLVLVFVGVSLSTVILTTIFLRLLKNPSEEKLFLFSEKSGSEYISGYEKSGLLVCYTMPLIFIVGILYQVSIDMLLLPRYLIPLVPFAIGTMVIFFSVIKKKTIGNVLLCLFVLFSIVNHNGIFYPKTSASFSIVERSHEYRKFHQLQSYMLDRIEKQYSDIPAFVTREVWYMGHSPLLGYIQKPLPNMQPIFRDDYRTSGINEFPAEFVLLLSNFGHGGEQMVRLLQEAQEAGSYRVEQTDVSVGRFSGAILHFSVRSETEKS